MTFKILSYIVMSFFLYSCGNTNQVAEIDVEQLDLLIDTNISISKGVQKVPRCMSVKSTVLRAIQKVCSRHGLMNSENACFQRVFSRHAHNMG